MQLDQRFVLRLTLALLLLPPHLAAGAASCGVRLNEFCAAPGRDWNTDGLFSARDDEWVELVNTGTTPVDLASYLLTDADSTWRWGGADLLHPGEHRVVYGSDAVTWERDHGQPVFGLSLANAGDAVLLWQVAGPETLLVETYAYRAHEAGTDRAVGRVPDTTGEWALFDGLNPYTGTLDPRGNGCNPSPRMPNQCAGTVVAPSTWGRVKSAYR